MSAPLIFFINSEAEVCRYLDLVFLGGQKFTFLRDISVDIKLKWTGPLHHCRISETPTFESEEAFFPTG